MIETVFSLIENSRGWNAVALAVVSAIVYALASNIAWRVAQSPDSGLSARINTAVMQPAMRAAYQIVRLLFYIGVPFLALYLGWIDLRAMGLGLMDWAEGVRWTIVILLAAWLVLMVIWLPYLHATADVPAPSYAALSFPRRVVEFIYMQAHWAFYRAALIVFFTGVIPEALYWGAIFGLGLVCVEAFANPRLRTQLTHIGDADGVVWNAGQAVLNTLAFVVTRNLFLLALIQLVLELTVPHLRAPASSERGGTHLNAVTGHGSKTARL